MYGFGIAIGTVMLLSTMIIQQFKYSWYSWSAVKIWFLGVESVASTYRVYCFYNFFFSRMWEITLWFTRSGGGISSRLSNWIFRYQIWFILHCFLSKSISFFIICNSSLLRWVEFIYSLQIHSPTFHKKSNGWILWNDNWYIYYIS